jgi:hypothetical protein
MAAVSRRERDRKRYRRIRRWDKQYNIYMCVCVCTREEEKLVLTKDKQSSLGGREE